MILETANFEFLRNKIFSKDELIKYLMKTQTAIVNLVTTAKNLEKTQEKIKKLNVSEHQQQQNLRRQHVQQPFLRKHNICQDQPQFEHDFKRTSKKKKKKKKKKTAKNLSLDVTLTRLLTC